jgi:hypothetical protein
MKIGSAARRVKSPSASSGPAISSVAAMTNAQNFPGR